MCYHCTLFFRVPIVFLQVWLVDTVVDIGGTPVIGPHVALVSKDSDRPADWVLSLGLWNLMGLTSKPMWNSSENVGSKPDRTIALFLLDTWSWTYQNAHTIKQYDTRGMLMFVCRSPECRHFSCWHPRPVLWPKILFCFWHSFSRPRWVKGLWTVFMQFDGAGHVSCQFVSIICFLFRY